MGVEVDGCQDITERLVVGEISFRVEDLNNLVLDVVVLWIRRDYIPHVGLKWKSQTSDITVGTRSQDGSCSHSEREKSVHCRSSLRLVKDPRYIAGPLLAITAWTRQSLYKI